MSMKSQDAFLRALAVSEKHIDDVLRGITMIEGKPCTIKSIESIDGGQRVTFQWTADDGTTKTQTMDVMDGIDGADGQKGDKGDPGVGLPEGGTVGQVLVKKSSTDYDMEWDTPGGGGDMLKSVYDTDNDGKVNSAENADTVGGHTVAKDVPADAKFTDTVYDDTEIREEIADKVDKVSGKGLSTEDYTSEEKTKLAGVEASAEVNTIESITLNGTEVTPDANKNVALTVITNTVNNLVNYYLKSETYTKTEVDDIVTVIKNSRFEVVATLPTTDIKTNVIYLVPKSPSQTSNVKDEYINLDGTTAGWEEIGDTEIDLSNYVTTQALNTALADYTTTADLTTLLAGKQDTLTFDDAPTENSDNPVKSGGVYSANQNIYEVMGQMGAKNLITYPHSGKTETKAGITFTENADGSVTVNGTATEIVRHLISSQQFEVGKKYILSGCPSGGSHSLNGTYTLYTQTVQNYDDGEGVEFTWDASITGITIAVFAGITVDNLTFYPMIRLASDTDATYQPYAKTNQQLTAENQTLTNNVDVLFETGVKNICPPYLGSYSSNGITYIGNSDGTVTVNGTCSANVGANIRVYLKAGQYKVSGCPSGGSYSTYRIGVTTDSWTLIGTHDHGNGTTITIPSDGYYRINLDVREGYVANNLVFKPMITDVDTPESNYDHYVPYAKTNKQLTEDSIDWDNFSELGAVNMLPNTATTQTINGVTFTVNADGSITVNGTASATLVLEINQEIPLDSSKSYILNGCADGGEWEGYRLDVYEHSNGLGFIGVQTTEELIISNKSSAVVRIRIASGTVISNKTFKPMLRLASDPNNTYQPYAMTNQQITPYVQSISNPNLLDNPWFTVNQRGQSSYTGGAAYSLDRWRRTSARTELTVNSDYITFASSSSATNNSYVEQYIEDDIAKRFINKIVTVSILYADGHIEKASGLVPNYFGTSDSQTIIDTDSYSNSWLRFFYYGASQHYAVSVCTGYPSKSTNIKAVKLELGTVSTLAMDTAPNYQQELAKCQRYYQRIWQKVTTDTLCIAVQRSNTLLRTVLPLTVPMRANPTVTVSGTVSDYTNSGLTMSKISGVVENGGIIGLNFNITKSGVTWSDGEARLITPDANDFYIDISADL